MVREFVESTNSQHNMEINLECPEEMVEEISDILVKCMVEGAKPFCTRVYLGADIEVSDHWIH